MGRQAVLLTDGGFNMFGLWSHLQGMRCWKRQINRLIYTMSPGMGGASRRWDGDTDVKLRWGNLSEMELTVSEIALWGFIFWGCFFFFFTSLLIEGELHGVRMNLGVGRSHHNPGLYLQTILVLFRIIYLHLQLQSSILFRMLTLILAPAPALAPGFLGERYFVLLYTQWLRITIKLGFIYLYGVTHALLVFVSVFSWFSGFLPPWNPCQ